MPALPRTLLACALAAALAGCASSGTGQGRLTGPANGAAAVPFNWQSTDGGISGTLSARLPEHYFEGRFFQITEQTRLDTLAPLWLHWRRGWPDWPRRGGLLLAPWPMTEFVTHYSGQVLATLLSPGQPPMRCRFQLVDPARGMAGGGEGECQLGDGRQLDALLNPSPP